MNDEQIAQIIVNYFNVKTPIREQMREVDDQERRGEIAPWDAAERWQTLDNMLTTSQERIAYNNLYQQIQNDDELEKRFRKIYSEIPFQN